MSPVSDVATEAPADGTPEGLEIRVLTSATDLRHTVTLFNQVWGTVTPLVGVELLRALVMALTHLARPSCCSPVAPAAGRCHHHAAPTPAGTAGASPTSGAAPGRCPR